VIFPDLLLIDPYDLPTGKLWWYSKRSVHCVEEEDGKTTVDAANAIFRVLCNKGRSAIWSEFTSDNIGNIPIATNREATTAELFFALEYYRDWLAWIEDHAGTDPDASTLATWQAAEGDLLDDFVSSASAGDIATHVLDVGCGFGRHLLDISKKSSALTGVGVDVIPNMVAEAAREARMTHLADRLYFCKDDATLLETCGDGEFDLAICMTNTLGNMRPEQATLAVRQMHRCLKVGGEVLVSVYSSQSVAPRLSSYKKVKLHVEERPGKIIEAAEGLVSAYFDERGLRQLFSDNGFTVASVETVGSIGLGLRAVKATS
jgi:ubiquinone/menaquinone biosynthesis C-methylase UbiE